jgi:AraC-like DNA-binding protein
MSPMRYVAERRLAATYRALLRAGPQASVTRIALANGFDHFGRFAQLYREVIGELPSQTLARRRPRIGLDHALRPQPSADSSLARNNQPATAAPASGATMNNQS